MELFGKEFNISWRMKIILSILVLLFIIFVFCKTKNYHKDFWDYFLKLLKSKKKLTKKRKRENKTENKCRSILEKIYDKPFPSIRPKFLKNPYTKRNLELDCYNPELRIALEYNGKQHYEYIPYFHKNKKAFESQVHRDDWKRNKCKELGINLIEIPYWIPNDNLKDYIKKELKKKKCI